MGKQFSSDLVDSKDENVRFHTLEEDQENCESFLPKLEATDNISQA